MSNIILLTSEYQIRRSSYAASKQTANTADIANAFLNRGLFRIRIYTVCLEVTQLLS